MKKFVVLAAIGSMIVFMGAAEVLAQANIANTPAAEVAVLKAQLETMRQYQDRFISMAQWSLGTVIGLAFALAAFSWFNNKTSYERDRDALRQASKNLSDEVRAALLEEIRQASRDLDRGLENRQSTIQKAFEKVLDARIEKLTARIAKLNDELLELKSNAVQREAEESEKTGTYPWAIYKYCELLELSVRRQTDHYEAGDTLDAIRKILDKPGLALDADIVTGAVETLKRLPPRYHAAAEGLIQLLKKALT
jgi:hypothetical protein